MSWNRDPGSRPMPMNPMGSDPFSPDPARVPEPIGKYQPPMTARGGPGRDFDFQRNQGHGGYPDDEYRESQRPPVEYPTTRAPSSSQFMPPRPVPAPVEYPSQTINARNYIPTGRNDSEYYDRGREEFKETPRKPPPPPTITQKSSVGVFQDYLGIPKSSQNSSVSTSTASTSNSISKPNQYFLDNQYRSLSSERRLPTPVPSPKPQQRPSPEKDLSLLIKNTQKSMNDDVESNRQKSGGILDTAKRKIQSREPSSRWSANPVFLNSNYIDDVYKGKEVDKFGFAVRSNPELMTSMNPTSNQVRSRYDDQRRVDQDRSQYSNERNQDWNDRRSTDLSRNSNYSYKDQRNDDYRMSTNEPLDRRYAEYENADQEGRSLQMVQELKEAAELRALQEKAKALEEIAKYVQGPSQGNNPVFITPHVPEPNPGVILDQLNQAIVQAFHEQIGGGGASAPGPPISQPTTICNQFYMRGYCKRGASCKMKHVEGPEVLKGYSDLCFRFKATGKCDQPNCKYVHEEPKTKDGGKKTTEKVVGICSRFRDFGNCKFGKECWYSHDVDKVDICTWFRDYGRCKFGNNCAFSHKIDGTEPKNNDQESAKEINKSDKTSVMAKEKAVVQVQEPKAAKDKNTTDKSITDTIPSNNENDIENDAKATIQNNKDDEIQSLGGSIDQWRSSPKIVDLRQKIMQNQKEKHQEVIFLEKQQQKNDLSLPKPSESATIAKPNQSTQKPAVISKPNLPTQKPAVKKPVFDVSRDRTKKMIVMIEMIVLVYHLFSLHRSKRMIVILILKIQGVQIVNVSYHPFRHH